MQVAERHDRSSSSYLLRMLFIKPWASQLTKTTLHDKEESPQLKPPFLVRQKCNVEERQLESIWLYDITDKNDFESPTTSSRKPKRVFYVAGGSWQAPPDDAHWKFLSDLVRRLDKPAAVTLISCPLAPKSPAEITYHLLGKLYEALSADSAFEKEDVFFAGDSSGGNISLSLVMQSISQGMPPPAGIILISPTVDLSHRHPGLEEAQKHDPLESLEMVKGAAKAWAQDLQETDPRLSPALGDIKVLRDHNVKVFGIIAGDDVLSVEAEDFVKHCQEIGIQGRWLLWQRQLHDFPIMSPYKFPESVKAVEWIALAANAGLDDSEVTHEKFEELERKSLKSFSKHISAAKLFRQKIPDASHG